MRRGHNHKGRCAELYPRERAPWAGSSADACPKGPARTPEPGFPRFRRRRVNAISKSSKLARRFRGASRSARIAQRHRAALRQREQLVAQRVADRTQFAREIRAGREAGAQSVATAVGEFREVDGDERQRTRYRRRVASGSSVGASQTPTSPRARRAVALAPPQSGAGRSPARRRERRPASLASRSSVQRSSTTARSLMSGGIDAFLERLEADPPHGVDEALVVVAASRRRRRSSCTMTSGTSAARERRADHLAERRVVALRAAERDLVPLLAVLVDAEDADVADVVVAARVHAAGHVELEVADVVAGNRGRRSGAGSPRQSGSTSRWRASRSRRPGSR